MRWLFPEKEIKIDTICLDCGEPITVRMKDEDVIEVDPDTTVGYMLSPFVQWREGSGAFN